MGSSERVLTGAKLRLEVFAGTVPVVELCANNGGNPGAVVASFTNPSFGTGEQEYQFSANTPFTLAANATYWLTARRETTSSFTWIASGSHVVPTGPYASSAGTRFSSTGGASWSDFTGFIAPTYEIQGSPPGDAPSVPEPTSALLFLPALTAVGILNRRRAGSPSQHKA